jgi:hypothetical protein
MNIFNHNDYVIFLFLRYKAFLGIQFRFSIIIQTTSSLAMACRVRSYISGAEDRLTRQMWGNLYNHPKNILPVVLNDFCVLLSKPILFRFADSFSFKALALAYFLAIRRFQLKSRICHIWNSILKLLSFIKVGFWMANEQAQSNWAWNIFGFHF